MANFKQPNYQYYYIYRIANLVNKKCYVGFHATNKEYDKDNYFGSGVLIAKAIKKYGNQNFIKGIIEYINVEEWKEKESFWIKEMKSHVSEWGYNQTWGGEGSLGLIMSEESREKSRKSAKNKPPIKEETIQKLIDKAKERKMSDKCKAALIKSITGRKKSKEELDLISRKDWHHSSVTKLNMSKTRLGVKRGPYKKRK
jgi:group I intron endonuclease